MKPLNFIKVILLCSVTLLLQACELKVKQRPDKSVGFAVDHYAINVSDLERSVAFYQDIFDLKEIKDGTDLDHIRWFRLGDAEELHIIQVDSLDKKLPKGVRLGLSTGDFESFRESITQKNIAYSDWPGKANEISLRPDGIQRLYIQDPDGYWIAVNNAKQKIRQFSQS